MLSALVEDTPKWCVASLAINSRTHDRSTALPSKPREKGDRPAPFS